MSAILPLVGSEDPEVKAHACAAIEFLLDHGAEMSIWQKMLYWWKK